MTAKSKDSPLRCAVEGDELVVRIGIGRLAWWAKQENAKVLGRRFKVIDERQWAIDVAKAINRDNELGETILLAPFERAMRDARDDGSTGISYPK